MSAALPAACERSLPAQEGPAPFLTSPFFNRSSFPFCALDRNKKQRARSGWLMSSPAVSGRTSGVNLPESCLTITLVWRTTCKSALSSLLLCLWAMHKCDADFRQGVQNCSHELFSPPSSFQAAAAPLRV